jgi:N-acetylglutamate synthase-like GNAT family acetyltransferase
MGTITIRPAVDQDRPGIIKVLDEADLRYSTETLNRFTVAELDREIVGVVRLEEYPDFNFLSSLGVLPSQERKGVASALLQTVLKGKHKPVYLYTIIPAFFLRFGFIASTQFPGLPAREIFGCEQCFPERCVTMVRPVQ